MSGLLLADRGVDGTPSAQGETASLTILVVEARTLLRDCLVNNIGRFAGVQARGVVSARDIATSEHRDYVPDLVLFCVSEGANLPSSTLDVLPNDERYASRPIIVLANDRPALQVLDLLKAGIRGFIPTSMSIDVAVQAIRLVHAGGTFIPESCLRSMPSRTEPPAERNGVFTHRQLQVVEAIKKGKPNKIIAYELNMCESTVKVHVRTIMKKLHARNRTQVAYLYSAGTGLGEQASDAA